MTFSLPQYFTRGEFSEIKDDLRLLIELTITKEVTGIDGWRTNFCFFSSGLPLILLTIDMLLNRIHMPGKFIFSNFVLILFYLFSTMIYQIIEKNPPFSENLNWFCDRNLYYYLDINKIVVRYFTDEPCNELNPDYMVPGVSCYR